jgi:hypothetical protein
MSILLDLENVGMVLSVTTDIRTKTKGDTFITRIEQIISRSELKDHAK